MLQSQGQIETPLLLFFLPLYFNERRGNFLNSCSILSIFYRVIDRMSIHSLQGCKYLSHSLGYSVVAPVNPTWGHTNSVQFFICLSQLGVNKPCSQISPFISGVCLSWTWNHPINKVFPPGRRKGRQNPTTKHFTILTTLLPPHSPFPWEKDYFSTNTLASVFGLGFMFLTNGAERCHSVTGPYHAPLPPGSGDTQTH